MKTTTPAPLCINCRHMKTDSSDGTPLCGRSILGRRSLIDGRTIYPECDQQRIDGDWLFNLFFGKPCGEKGLFFEPKEISK